MNASIANIVVYTEFTKKKVFEQLMLAAVSSARSRIDTFCLPWRRRAEDTATNVGHSKTFNSKVSCCVEPS